MLFADNWMDWDYDLKKIKQSQKDKYGMFPLIHEMYT
jgi:hypothetical protein